MGKTTTNRKTKVGFDAAPAASPVMMVMVKEEPQEEEEIQEETWGLITVIDHSKKAERAINCRTKGCSATAVAIWQSTDDPNGMDLWPLCEPGQEKDFGGRPDDKADLSATATITTTTTESKQEAGDAAAVDEVGITDGTASKGITPTSNASDGSAVTETAEEGAVDDAWKILPVEEITKFPIQCDEEECNLLAAVVWTSSKDPSEKWRGCLDCQNLHFGGWPSTDELPVKHMTQEHKDFILNKCSRHQDSKMPEFSKSPSPTKRNGAAARSNTLTTPPPPNAGILDTHQKKNGKGKKPLITPSPGGMASLQHQQQQQSKKKKSAATSQYNKKQAGKIREWNEAAARMGGPGSFAIIDNATAKETIFKFLYDTFRPMNINTIYREMKAAVPSPILCNCLASMAFDTDSSMQFAHDSDDDKEDNAAKKDKKKSPKKKQEDAESYTGAVSFKTAKGGPKRISTTSTTTVQRTEKVSITRKRTSSPPPLLSPKQKRWISSVPSRAWKPRQLSFFPSPPTKRLLPSSRKEKRN